MQRTLKEYRQEISSLNQQLTAEKYQRENAEFQAEKLKGQLGDKEERISMLSERCRENDQKARNFDEVRGWKALISTEEFFFKLKSC